MEPESVLWGFVIAVILIALVNCLKCKSKSKAANPAGGAEGMLDLPTDVKLQPYGPISDSGSGVVNRVLSNQYAKLQELKGYDDYNEVAQFASLEPEVFKSHEEYSTDINNSTSGASSMSVRSDPNDVNPWVGLKRPDYHSVYAQDDVRVDSSEFPDQMTSATHYTI